MPGMRYSRPPDGSFTSNAQRRSIAARDAQASAAGRRTEDYGVARARIARLRRRAFRKTR